MNYSNPITVQSVLKTRDSYGQPQESYTDAFKVGANIVQASGTIAVSAAKETETVHMFFDVRRTENTLSIETTNRLVTVDGDAWDIYNIDKYSMQKDNSIRITARLRR